MERLKASEAENTQCADVGTVLQTFCIQREYPVRQSRDAVICGAVRTFRLAGEKNMATYR